MLRGEAAPPEISPRPRRPIVSGPSGVILALTSPPTAAHPEALWPSWLSPIGASWRRPGPNANAKSPERSE